MVTAFATQQCGPGSIPGFSPSHEGISLGIRYYPLHKNQIPNSNSIRIENPNENQTRMMCGFLSEYCNLLIYIEIV